MGIRNIKFDEIRTRLTQFGWKIINDWSFSLASLLSYYLLISVLPLTLSILSVSSLLFRNNSQIQTEIRTRLAQTFPEQGFSKSIDVLFASLSKKAGVVFLITFIVSVFTGSRFFIGMDDVLTVVYRIRERRVIHQNVYAIKMLLVFIICMPVIIISAAASAVLLKKEIFYTFLSTLLSGLFSFFLLNLIYYFVPNKKMSFRNTWCGALFAAAGLLILFLLFPIYVHYFMTDYVGQLGSIIVALLLFYVLGLLLVIGAQINAFFFEDIQPLPTTLGNCVCTFADHENVQLINGDHHMETLIEGVNPKKNDDFPEQSK